MTADRGAYLPPPPPHLPRRGAEAPLAPEMRRRRNRLVALLVLVPFSFPAWYAARRSDPELARRTRFAVVVNYWQSAVLTVVVAVAVLVAANREAIVGGLAERLGDFLYRHWYAR